MTTREAIRVWYQALDEVMKNSAHEPARNPLREMLDKAVSEVKKESFEENEEE